jgi:DNA-directed RNA polymerase specialized sigma24 family protein
MRRETFAAVAGEAWPGVLAAVRRRWHCPPELAEDATQHAALELWRNCETLRCRTRAHFRNVWALRAQQRALAMIRRNNKYVRLGDDLDVLAYGVVVDWDSDRDWAKRFGQAWSRLTEEEGRALQARFPADGRRVKYRELGDLLYPERRGSGRLQKARDVCEAALAHLRQYLFESCD